MGKRAPIILIVALAGALVYFWFFIYGPPAAFYRYKTSASQIFRLQAEKAAPHVLPTAKAGFETATRFYTSNYGQFREGFGYPKYEIESEERSEDGKTIKYVIHQTVKADMPGSTSLQGTMMLAFQHRATMKRDGIGWKIASMSFSKAQLAKEPIKKKVVDKSHGSLSGIFDPLKEMFAKLTKSDGHSAKQASAFHNSEEGELEGAQTFKLVSGKTVRGKVVAEDDVFYTVEDAFGNQTIVIKQDIAS